VAVAEDGAAPGSYYTEADAPHASLYFSEELFLPAHNAAHRSGARTRVSNILCFGSSKLFFSAHLHERFPSHVPIAIHVSHHEHPDAPMRALIARYGGRGEDASVLTPFLIERVSQQDKAWCAAQRTYRSSAADGSAKLVAYVTSHGPWAWSGMTPFRFQPAGELSTPWGPGRWGPLPGTDNALYADFVGSKHNIRFDLADPSQFTSARCGDGEPVLGRLASGKP